MLPLLSIETAVYAIIALVLLGGFAHEARREA